MEPGSFMDSHALGKVSFLQEGSGFSCKYVSQHPERFTRYTWHERDPHKFPMFPIHVSGLLRFLENIAHCLVRGPSGWTTHMNPTVCMVLDMQLLVA